MKICRKCKEEKPLNEFFKKKKSKDGYDNICKKCASVYWLKPKEVEDGYKKCTKCGEIKEKDKFSKRTSTKSGLRSICKDCDKKYKKDNAEYYLHLIVIHQLI